MGVQKEDVEKFLNGNPAFAKQYFAKKLNPASISKMSGLPEKDIDISQFQELSQVNVIISPPPFYLEKRASIFLVTFGKFLYLL